MPVSELEVHVITFSETLDHTLLGPKCRALYI
jgi:hypothetical protein